MYCFGKTNYELLPLLVSTVEEERLYNVGVHYGSTKPSSCLLSPFNFLLLHFLLCSFYFSDVSTEDLWELSPLRPNSGDLYLLPCIKDRCTTFGGSVSCALL